MRDQSQNLRHCFLFALAEEDHSKSPKTDLSYSYVMRKLRQDGNDKVTREFQQVFKEAFDRAIMEELESPEDSALMMAMQEIGFKDKA